MKTARRWFESGTASLGEDGGRGVCCEVVGWGGTLLVVDTQPGRDLD